MTSNRFSIRARTRSFSYSFNGLRAFLRTEHNAWVHLAATILVVAAGIGFRATRMEWMLLVFAMGLVWVTETLNTCFEKLLDHLSPEQHPAVGTIKDMASAAVLLASIAAVIIGAIVFIPKIIVLL